MAQQGGRRAWGQRLGMRRAGPALLALLAVTLLLGCAGLGFSALTGQGIGLPSLGGTELTRAAPVDDEAAAVDTGGDEEPEAAPPELEVCVHVDGAVEHPGVYVLRGASPRVGEAVELAGGLAADADTTTVNLAAVLSDGQKVYVPREGEAVSEAAAPVEVSGTASGGLVNINTASAEELQTLPGIGEVTARAIVDEREQGGSFSSVEDIMRVSGIGEKKFERIRGQICV